MPGLGVLDNEDHHQGQRGHQGLEDDLPPRGKLRGDADDDPGCGGADDEHRGQRAGGVPVQSRQPPADTRALCGRAWPGHGIPANRR